MFFSYNMWSLLIYSTSNKVFRFSFIYLCICLFVKGYTLAKTSKKQTQINWFVTGLTFFEFQILRLCPFSRKVN